MDVVREIANMIVAAMVQNIHDQPHAVDQNGGLPLPPANPDLEKLFRLSDEERRWALELKAAVEASDDLENLPDLLYCQFVITNTARGDLESTLEQVQGLQDFRHEYNIEDTFEEAMQILTDFTRANPGCLLSVAYDNSTENFGLVYDRTRFQFRTIRSPAQWRVYLGCPYYLFNMLCPDPYSMRQGIFLIGECDGMERSDTNVEIVRTCWSHLLSHFPVYFRSIKFFHTNVATNIAYSMMKPFLPADVKENVMVGCQFGANISSLYLRPTPQLATERTLRRMEDFLRTRYRNQAAFSLSASPQQHQQQQQHHQPDHPLVMPQPAGNHH
ncbi:expressed unknown protein [Seminavis robusta]|uniref:CRAL-TRIO domain-containing protein n=1 Tax=Seminavis robusta TaxID=568900 RepID=A0A9N8DA66_9STRA|nr:expressed unknown protein [Seminavis robusta]|eukprot:Sro9_g007410.1 n/a (329) ;mRNA; r:139966-140952